MELDGNSRAVDTYDWITGVGKLVKQTDTSGNSLTFGYTGNRLTMVTDQDGEKLLLDYAGNNLSQIRTLKLDGSTVTRVRYGYDASNRLTSVIVDLSPDDNSISDGNTYVTSYSYDGGSTRLASLLESDGTQATFTYTQIAGSWYIASSTQLVDGVARTTRYDYETNRTAGPQTRVTDPLGQVTLVAYDNKGQLLKVSGPLANGVRQTVSYTYDINGNVLTQTDGLSNVNTYTYDANGNKLSATDPLGNLVKWTYGASNQLLSENYSFSINQSLARTGALVYAVEPGKVFAPAGLQGSGSILAENMGGVPEGYQAHHLVMSSLAQESEALQYLAKKGLYDVNRASNGLTLPGNEFLALVDDMPLHSGFHGAEYRGAVSDGLNRLDAALQMGASDTSLLMRTGRLEQSLSNRILSGDLWLNSRDAQLRNLGAFGQK